jgi:tellurite resistance protein TerC
MEGFAAWLVFFALVLIMLFLDLGVFHKKNHEVKIKEALAWSGVWILLAIFFAAGIFYVYGKTKALEFLTGYVIEKSLSIDNIFVFIMIFGYFGVKAHLQHKILFWGVMGALILRALFIVLGVSLINSFHWIIYIFGAFLIITGVRMLFEKEKKLEPDKNPLVRLFKLFMPVTNDAPEDRFFVKKEKRTFATSLFIALIIVEFSDLIFAIDSIPAVLAISNDTFIVYTSNVFAILGLRSLYFALSGIMQYFYYLKYALVAILVFVGTKMVLSGFLEIPIWLSLSIIIGLLLIAILGSIIRKRQITRV